MAKLKTFSEYIKESYVAEQTAPAPANKPLTPEEKAKMEADKKANDIQVAKGYIFFKPEEKYDKEVKKLAVARLTRTAPFKISDTYSVKVNELIDEAKKEVSNLFSNPSKKETYNKYQEKGKQLTVKGLVPASGEKDVPANAPIQETYEIKGARILDSSLGSDKEW